MRLDPTFTKHRDGSLTIVGLDNGWFVSSNDLDVLTGLRSVDWRPYTLMYDGHYYDNDGRVRIPEHSQYAKYVKWRLVCSPTSVVRPSSITMLLQDLVRQSA